MVEVEVLFSSGQGIVLTLSDREAALQFMQRAMEGEAQHLGLTHFSTEYEEVLIDLADISFVRLKKENYPRLQEGHTLRLPAHSEPSRLEKHRHANPQEAIQMGGKTASEPIQMPGSHSQPTPAEQPPENPLESQLKRAQGEFGKAEARLGKIEEQSQKVESQLAAQRKQQTEIEDELKEAKLRKDIEDIELSQEIDQMKKQG